MKDAGSSVVLDRQIPGLSTRLIEGFATEAAKAAGLRYPPDILITTNRKIRELNSRFRGKHSATDVLSFPPLASNGTAGDIAISLDIAARTARLLGHSVSDEVRILILHGVLHLAGYDHENDRGEMARKEMALRRKFGLATGLIERNLKAPKAPLVVGGTSFANSSASRRPSQRPRASGRRRSRT